MSSKKYRFDCPACAPRIVEARSDNFLEDLEQSRSISPRKTEIEGIQTQHEESNDNGGTILARFSQSYHATPSRARSFRY